MSGRLFLIDGHALVFKMYYAFLRRPMINSKGADMSILYGFTKYILELIEKEKPTHIAVSFDPPGGTFRNEMYPAYKANRPDTPQLVIDALEPLTELVKCMNIPVLMELGFEADDVIGSMALRSASEGIDVYMVTPDKDYGQLIRDHVFQYKPGKSGSENELVDSESVCQKYGIQSPSQVIDMLAICGDAADNVPGVKGVGEVGAAKLISKYGSLENIYAHIDELSPRQRSMFEEAQSHIGLSKELVTIKTDIHLETSLRDMELDMNFMPRLAELFDYYEFGSLKKYLGNIKTHAPETSALSSGTSHAGSIAIKAVSTDEIKQLAIQTGALAFAVSAMSEGISSDLKDMTVAVALEDTSCAVAVADVSQFRPLMEDEQIKKYGYGIKLQLNQLAHAGIALNGKLMDVELMHYLLNPERSHALDMLAMSMLGVSIENSIRPSSAPALSLFDDLDTVDEAEADRSAEVAAIALIGEKLENEIVENDLSSLYFDVEEPLIAVLGRMERNGVKVDVASLNAFARELRSEMIQKEALVRELAGEPSLNVSSPKQIGEVLFEKLKLDPKAKKSAKGSWSTDEETLSALSDKSPVIQAILDFRAVKKLLSTYIEPFPGYISSVDGRVHTTFNQALTSTGRLSSSNPNLQNIPIRTERGKEIRRAFVAGKSENFIMSADYSQIELRIMAHLCCDAHLVRAFNDGQDIHSATASKIFGIPIAEVTSDQRRIAKTANFGIMYGISSFGLAQRLGCSRSEAKKIIDDYFESFPAIKLFINDTVEMTREDGYVETLFGRRRYIPDINAKNAVVRSIAERNAVNAPIQGTSADIIKLAMIAIDRRMQEKNMKSLMVLQIHDELVFEVVPEELEELRSMVISEMENVIKLSIPLTVECKYGRNWLESH